MRLKLDLNLLKLDLNLKTILIAAVVIAVSFLASLKAMEWLGLVWDIREVPVYVRDQKRKQETLAGTLSAAEG